MIDRNDTIKSLKTNKLTIKIELGVGERKRHNNAIGIDILDYDGVDIVGDVFDILRELPDCCVEQVWSYHFIEHIDDLDGLLEELHRVCTKGAKIDFVAPHFSNPFFYSDPTHKRSFGLYTMSYYSEDLLFARNVPKYYKDLNFLLAGVRLIFKSTRPRYIRHAIKKPFQYFFNINNWFKEFYEEIFCYVIPCYEVHYTLINK